MARIEIDFTQSKAAVRSLEMGKSNLSTTLNNLISAKANVSSLDGTIRNIDMYRQNIDNEVKIIRTDIETLTRFTTKYKAFIIYAENEEKQLKKVIKDSGYNFRVNAGISDSKFKTTVKVVLGVVIIAGTVTVAVVAGGPVATGAAIGACIGGAVGLYKGDADSFLKYTAFGAATGFVFGGGAGASIGSTASNLLSKGVTNNVARKLITSFGTGLVDDVILSFASGGVKGVKENFAGIVGDNIFDSALGVFGNSNKFVSKTLYAADNIEVPKVKKAADAAKDITSSIKKLNKIDLDDVKEVGTKGVGKAKPNQVHHFATNKSKKYTKQFEDITKKYDLELDDAWNKELMPHQGRHPYAYHEYVLREMTKYDNIARGNKEKFLKLYEQLKNKVINNPDMLTKDYWK